MALHIFTTHSRPSVLSRNLARFIGLAAPLLLLLSDPALANKFETIGGGFSGSTRLKVEWLQGFLFTVGGIGLLTAAMAVLVPHNNASFLNFGNWKQSAIIATVIGVVSLTGALLL